MVNICEYVFQRGNKKGSRCTVKCRGDNKMCYQHSKQLLSKEPIVYIPEVSKHRSDNCYWTPEEINIPIPREFY